MPLDQNKAPIYEALEKFKKMRVVPFDVPGHMCHIMQQISSSSPTSRSYYKFMVFFTLLHHFPPTIIIPHAVFYFNSQFVTNQTK